jgi:hypothetical protein
VCRPGTRNPGDLPGAADLTLHHYRLIDGCWTTPRATVFGRGEAYRTRSAPPRSGAAPSISPLPEPASWRLARHPPFHVHSRRPAPCGSRRRGPLRGADQAAAEARRLPFRHRSDQAIRDHLEAYNAEPKPFGLDGSRRYHLRQATARGRVCWNHFTSVGFEGYYSHLSSGARS